MSTGRGTLGRRVGGVAAALLLAAGPATALEPPDAGMEPLRYLVRFDAGADADAVVRGLRTAGLGVGSRFRHAIRGAVVTARPGQAAALAHRPGIAAVAPDTPVSLAGPWGLDRVDQRALPLSGTFTPPGDGAGVRVYVVDTGVLSDHVDLAGRVAVGYSAIDGSPTTEDCFGHGTHVAGTAAGATYGVARAATVVPVRVMGCDGNGTTADVLQGLDWVAGQHTASVPAVVNLSLTTPGNVVLDAAVQGVVDDGIVVTAAAGNKNADACDASPGRVPAVLTVGATDDTDTEAAFGNDGSCLDLFAPGVGIVSAWHTSPDATETLSGTSMASPHVAGAAAVVLGARPTLSPSDVAAGLVAASTRGVVTGETVGTPDRLLYIGALPPEVVQVLPPTRPRDVRARAGVRSAVVRWTRGTPRGTPVTRQTVRVYWKGELVRAVRVPATATRHRVLRMKPGRRVVFRVVAHSAAGPSLPSVRSNRVTIRR